MKYLTTDQVIKLHRVLIETSGGSSGIRDEGILNALLYANTTNMFLIRN